MSGAFVVYMYCIAGLYTAMQMMLCRKRIKNQELDQDDRMFWAGLSAVCGIVWPFTVTVLLLAELDKRLK